MVETTCDVECAPKKIEYPKLMKGNDYNCLNTLRVIVLFSGHKTGTVLWSSDTAECMVGYHANNWEMDRFKDYTGEITLKNI